MAIARNNIENIIIYTLPSFVGYALTLITMPIMTRLLVPAEYGIIIMAGIFPVIAIAVVSCGLAGATQRNYFEYRKDKEKLASLIVSSQVFLLVMFVLSSLVVFYFRDFIASLTLGDRIYGKALIVAYLSACFGYMISFFLVLYQSMERAKEFSLFTITQAVTVSLLSLLYVWHFKLSYMGPLLGSLTGNMLVFVVLSFRFNRQYSFVYDLRLLKENIFFGLQLVPKSFTGFINRFFDKYMLNNMLSLSAVGVYNIGQNVGNTLFALMTAVWNSFQPIFYKEVFDKKENARASVGRLYTIFAYLTLFPVLLIVLFAKEIVIVLAPPSYYGAIPVMMLFACAMSTNVFGIFVGLQYAYTKKAYWIFPVTVLGTIVNVAANILLIPKFGLMGGAMSTLICYVVLNGVLTYVGQKLFYVKYQWGCLLLMYLNIFAAAGSLIYLQEQSQLWPLLYVLKAVFFGSFAYVGYHSGILTRNNIAKIIRMFKRSEKQIASTEAL